MSQTVFSKEYAKLNAEQRLAVDTIEGPVMVVAGPGTGKTQILAMRIANILRETQTNASNILALTFTESGIKAIKERLRKIIGPVAYQVRVHTFHSFANEVILAHPEKFLFARQINQLTDLEQIEYVQKILDEVELKLIRPPKSPYHYQAAIIDTIGKLKQEGIEPAKFKSIVKKQLESFTNRDDLYHEKGPYKGKMKGEFVTLKEQLEKNLELVKVYDNYQNRLTNDGRYDYADMILFVLQAFRKDAALLSTFQEKFQYILVDEYQDTNSAQNELIRILASFYDEPNIFVVGDDEQSIYRFQGAALENILYFAKLYPHARTVVLKKNYRSAQKIIDVARSLIINNKSRLPIKKDFLGVTKTPGKVMVGEFSSGAMEDFFIAKEIKGLVKAGLKYSDIAVLFRQHRDGASLAAELGKLNIPYKLSAGQNVLADNEIRKLVRFIKVLDSVSGIGPADQDLFEIMHYSFFALSSLDIYKISRAAREKNTTIFDLIIDEKKLSALGISRAGKLRKFVKTIFSCLEFSQNHTFAETFEFILRQTGFLNFLVALDDAALRLNRLQSLFNEIKRLNNRRKDLTLHDFTQYLRLLDENNLIIQEEELEADFDGVNLITAHKAKGLEFEVVFIMRATDKNWGNRPSHDLIKLPAGLLKIEKNPEEEDEEERRLFYVAATRSKSRLYISYAVNYGDEDAVSLAMPTKFLAEIDQNLILPIETKKFEAKFADRLKLAFGEILWRPSRAVKDYLKGILAKFALSPTSLNTYLACPKKFFLDNLLRVPKVKKYDQAYGTAVHVALERFFRQMDTNQKVPAKTELITFFNDALKEEILSDKDLGRATLAGADVLSQYYDFYESEFGRASTVGLEYRFDRDKVIFQTVPITGAIDRIEVIDAKANTVRIIDYKTGRPKSLNYLLGETKEKDTSYLNQAYFYKILTDADPLFRWRVAEIVFDFVEPERGKFRRVAIPIEAARLKEFGALIKKTYTDISKLKFGSSKKACTRAKYPCDYADFCS